MAKVLQTLLDSHSPLFKLALTKLEKATGHSGVDVRLIADIFQRGHGIMRQLRLDPHDTTPQEFYRALEARADDSDLLTGMDFVGVILDGQVVSCNQSDVQANRGRPFTDRTVDQFRRDLAHEIVCRYRDHARTDERVVEQFAHDAGLKWYTDDNARVETKTKGENSRVDRPYILAIGDIITDDFIELDENFAEVTTDDKGYKRLSFELGAKIPYAGVERVQAVECSPNAAVSIQRLGLNAGLMSWIGDDAPGEEMIAYLKEQGVNTDEMVIEPGMKSNYHYVLRFGADRTKLQRFENYAYQWRDPAVKPDWIYLGVLGEKTWPLHEAILKYLEQNPDIKLVFQPGMYHLMWGTEKLAPFYKHAEIVIMNREEAAQVTGRDRGDIQGLIDGLHELGVHVAVVTDGADGAYASNGEQRYFMPNYPDPKPPLDRTGAGDAFASTIAAALMLGESLETALRWAPINSMSVVQQMGAQAGLLGRDELQRYLDTAPEDYHPKEMQ